MSIQLRTYFRDSIDLRKSKVSYSPLVDPVFILKSMKRENEKRQNKTRYMLMKSAKFTAFFFFVMVLLYMAAFIFSCLEERNDGTTCQQRNNNTMSLLPFINEDEEYRFTECDIDEIRMFVEKLRGKRTKSDTGRTNEIQKWFYFVVVATTTIGYGDIAPQTREGKMFYCCFSIIGIILMMSLLKACAVRFSPLSTHASTGLSVTASHG